MCKGCCSTGGCVFHWITKILVIVGGINWGLVGLGMLLGSMSNWNVVNMLLGSIPMVEGIVYVVVGVSAILMIFGCGCHKCKDGVCMPSGNMDSNMGGNM